MTRLWLLAALVLFAAGCALTSKGKAVEVRWFTPEIVRPRSATPPPNGPPLRLGYVTSGTDLGERIAWGDGAYQMGFYEDRRWTERPAQFVTNALRRTLFDTHGFQPAAEATAPHLEVELLSFQEITVQHARAGRVALRVQLSTDHVLFDDTLSQVEPVGGEQFEDVVAAIARAQELVAEEVARRVEAALAGAK